MKIVSYDGRFIGGFYPDKEKLVRLKAEGYTDVISLLDPLALPYEPFLIHKEYNLTRSTGLNLIRIPMLPYMVKDSAAKQQIEQLAASTDQKKYYVHGNWDQDRVLTFMNMVDYSNQVPTKPRTLKKIFSKKTYAFQRGLAIQVDEHLIVAPHPTDDDFSKYILTSPNKYISTKIRTVVCVNPDEDKYQSEALKAQLKSQGIHYISIPINLHPYDSDKILATAKALKSLPGTLLLYSYFMPPQSTILTSITLSYLTNLPSLPINSLLSGRMGEGEVSIIAPNIVVGYRPTSLEYKNYLQPNGVKAVAYIGSCKGKKYDSEEHIAKSIGLKWYCYPSSKYRIIIQRLSSGGPWYVYGPELPMIHVKLSQNMHHLTLDYLLSDQ